MSLTSPEAWDLTPLRTVGGGPRGEAKKGSIEPSGSLSAACCETAVNSRLFQTLQGGGDPVELHVAICGALSTDGAAFGAHREGGPVESSRLGLCSSAPVSQQGSRWNLSCDSPVVGTSEFFQATGEKMTCSQIRNWGL